jgi:hypothetical protein
MLHRDKLNNGELQGYASGLFIGTYMGLQTVDHSGGDAGYRSDMTRFPDQHFSASVLCNQADINPSALVRKVADILLAKDLKAPAPAPAVATEPIKTVPPPPLTAEQMTAMAGSYWDREDGFIKLVVKDGKLEMEGERNDFHELVQFAPAHFHIADSASGEHNDLHFIAAEAGKPRHIEEIFDGHKLGDYDSITAASPSADELAAYVGAYLSEEIEPIYRIAVQDGMLTLTRLRQGPDTLRPAIHDVFVGDIGKIQFTRDASQHVDGFILDADRIQGFRFRKRTN